MEKDSEIVKLTERIAKDPKSKLFVPLAEEYRKIGDIEMAINVLQEGLKNNPGYITARSSLGRLLMEMGDLEGAQKELEEVIKAIPDNLLAQRKLGDLFILTGRAAEALERYKAALALNPNDKDVKSLVEDLGAGKDVSERIPKPKAKPVSPSPAEPAKTAALPAGQTKAAASATQRTPAVAKKPEASAPSGAAPSAAPAATTAPTAPPPAPAASPASAAPSAASPSTPAPTIPSPGPEAQQALPADKAPGVAPGSPPAAEEPVTAETIEEIVEIEHLEQPVVPGILEEPSSEPVVQETEASMGSIDLSGSGTFDISEQGADEEVAIVLEEGEQPTWEAPAEVPAAAPAGSIPAATAETNDDINTNTLAELYVTQGFYEKALEVYEGMLAERPDSAVLQQRIEKIRAMAGVAERNAGFGGPPASPVDDVPNKDIFAEKTPTGSPKTPAASAPPMPEPAASQVTPEPQGRPKVPPSVRPAPAAPAEPVPPKPAAPSGPQARRKETIDRLESWLKNIMKEKP